MSESGVKETRICILGLGYIGLPTAAIMATRGYRVLGVDIRQDIVDRLRDGQIHIEEPGLATVVNAAMMSGALQVATRPEPADAFVIAVPTPFKHGEVGEKGYKEADLSFVESAARAIVPHLRKGCTVILESTSPPGTTRNVVAPILEESGLRAGEDFYLAYSPERVLPGAILKEMITNHRVVGGINDASARKARDIYRKFVEGQVFETDCTTAEMVKLAENTFRDVNIALANELAKICERVGSNVWDVVRLANHHPRVNVHQPGPGVGGHCIAVDPWFLVEACPDAAQLIRQARLVNDAQPAHVVARIEDIVRRHGLGRIAFLGVTYKANIDDVRESPSLEIIDHFAREGADFIVHDPHVSSYVYPLTPSLDAVLDSARYLVFLVGHQAFLEIPEEKLAGKVILDTKNLFAGRKPLAASPVYYLLGRST